jgi:MYXO-CTERM domain-containing protein
MMLLPAMLRSQRFALAVAVLSLTASARGGTIEFGTATASPNTTASANTGAYGSDANVSVGYSVYTYNYSHSYGGLDSGSGDAIYSDNSPGYELDMTFTAAAGYTVTLDSFNLAQYSTDDYSVNISVTGGASSYSLTDTPPGGSGNFTTYSPNETGTALTLTITNLYDVGANTIVYNETSVGSAPEPSTALMAAAVGGMVLFGAIRRRRLLPAKTAGLA